MSSSLETRTALETCLDCGCALVGSESRFCTDCEDEIRADAAEYGGEPLTGGNGVDKEAVKVFLTQVNMDLNTLISSARDIQRSLKLFAVEHELPYVAFREDQRYNVPAKPAAPNAQTGGAA